MVQSANNNLIIKLNQKHQELLLFESGVKLYADTRLEPGEHVTITGEILSLPRRIQSDRPDYVGYSLDGIQVGDTAIFRYDLVFSYSFQPEHDTPIYKHMAMIDGNEYWKCDIQKLFGVIRDNQIHMVNGYVMCKPGQVKSKLIIPKHMTHVPRVETLEIEHIGLNIHGLQQGDKITVPHEIAQHYRIGTHSFCIIRQSHILGKYEEA